VKIVAHPLVPLVFSASLDFTLRMWDTRDGSCKGVLRGHTDQILDITLSS
jgi:hypothetical protein